MAELILLQYRNKLYFVPQSRQLINCILPLKADNQVLVMPRGSIDMLKKVLGVHAQVVTRPSVTTSGQLTKGSLVDAPQ